VKVTARFCWPRVIPVLVAALPSSLLVISSKSSAQALESVQQLSALSVYDLMPMATKRNVDAEEAIGLKYAYAEGVKWDLNKGIEWLRKAAQDGSADAECALGMVYDGGMIPSGHTLPSHYDKSVKWYGRAAKQGWCWLQLAEAYEDKAHADSQRRDVPAYHRDMEAAAYWWRKEAEPRTSYPSIYPYAKFPRGNPAAQSQMAYLYRFGLGVPQSYMRAQMWYRRAAEQGWGNALIALGRMYESGQGVPQDDELAYIFFGLAPEFLGPQCDRCTDYWLKSLSKKWSPEKVKSLQTTISQWRVGMPLPTAEASPVPRSH
jgi:TPR repeat protein